MYKMYLISAEGCKNADVHILIIKKIDEIWASMKDVGRGMGVTNISYLVLEETHGICETKKLTKKNKLMNTK